MLTSHMHPVSPTEQQPLGREHRAYLVRLMTPEYQAGLATPEGGGPLYMQTVRRLGADGWLGIGWPREYGGQGRAPIEQVIFFRQAARARVNLPPPPHNTLPPGPTGHRGGAAKARPLAPVPRRAGPTAIRH